MNIDKLYSIAGSIDKPLITAEIHTPNDFYGHASLLKHYAKLHHDYTIKAIVEHAPYLNSFIWGVELNARLPAIFCPTPHRVAFLANKTNKALFDIGSMILYAPHFLTDEALEKEKKCLGKNLLAFPHHSTHHVDVDYDISEYCKFLEVIGKDFNKIRICLYWKDVLRGHAKIYSDFGFECVTAGHMYDPLFLPRLKSIIETATVTTSTTCGTFVGYCIIMNKPHFLKITDFKLNAASQEILARDTGDGKSKPKSEAILNLEAAFGELRDDITDKQKELVDRYWGTSSFKTSQEMQTILSIAEDMYNRGPQFFLSNKNILLDQTNDYVSAGKDEYALVTLNQAVKVFPDIPRLLCVKAMVLAKTGQKKEAVDIARGLLQANPSLLEASELVKELEREMDVCSQPDARPDASKHAKKYLNLGCGSHYHPAWTNVDFHATGDGVLACDLSKGIPFEENSFDVVYHSHLLEHFPKSSALPFMHECYRVLKDNGIIRIVVPDLEQIARSYIELLEKSLKADAESQSKYDWIMLELFDQMVRNVPGGEMLKYWKINPMPAESFVIERYGSEVLNVLEAIRKNDTNQDFTPATSNMDAEQVGEFRLSGEIHQWMYDRYSLPKLMEQAGFVDIRVCRANESGIPSFNSYCLDINPDGSIRKPDSLFIEAKKIRKKTASTDKKAMKIVHLCMQDFGGAGNAAYRLHQGLRSIGIDSTMVVLNKRSSDPSVKVLPVNYDKDIMLDCMAVDSFLSPAWNKEWSKWVADISKYPNRPDGLEMFSAAESDVRLELVREILEADIFNLHWTSGVVDIPRAPLAFRSKPVVWTLHDMNPFTGGCHYADTCEKYMSACGACPQLGSEDDNDVSHRAWNQKHTAYEKLNINIITPSKWLGKCASKSTLFSKFPVTVIPYGFPIDIYKPHSKEAVRKALNISEKAKVILFGADDISNKRKGFMYLLVALNNLEVKGGDDIILLTFGNVPRDIGIKSRYPMINLGFMNDQNQIAAAYSAADLFVLPSLEDNLPNTVVESMACGTPVLGFNIGGIPDMVEHKKTGYLVKPRDVKGLIEGITWISNLSSETRLNLSDQCRKKAEEFYALQIQANNYKKVYEKLMTKEQSLLEEAAKFNKKGEVLFSNGNSDEAMGFFKKAVEIHPGFATAYNNLGVVSLKHGTTGDALEYYEKAVFHDPLNITFIKNLADYHYVIRKDINKALQMYIKGLTIKPEDTEILTTLGAISIEAGDLESAKDFYGRVLKIDPQNKDALKIIDLLNNQSCVITPEQPDGTAADVASQPGEYLASAIVSAYNSERFIRGCLEDLEAQTIADRLEIVVVDSCSQQNEKAIIEEFQKKYSNIKYIRTEKRETVYAAWNRGIKAASGKYITNANTDDRHRFDAFEQMIKILENDPEISLVYADVIITEQENETFDRHTPCGYFTWLDWDRNMLLDQGCFMGPQPMWRRSVHDEYGYFDESMVTSGDYEFWLRISQTHNFHHIHSQLGLYLKSPESIEHRNRARQYEENNKILSLYREAAKKARIIKHGPTDQLIQLSKEKNIKDNQLVEQVICRLEQAVHIKLSQNYTDSKWTEQDEEILKTALKSKDYREAFLLLKKAVLSGDHHGYLQDFIDVSSIFILSSTSWWPQKYGKKSFISKLASIVILTSNRIDYTKKCVKSIRRHTPEPHEIIFVDNGSIDGTVKWLQGRIKENKNYRLIENKENVGVAKGRNQGINLSQGEFVLLLDNDVVVSEGWLSGMLECLSHAPAVGIVGPMTNNIGGPQQVFSDEYRSVNDLGSYAAEFRKHYRHRRVSSGRIVGFCMLFKRALANQIGLLDESFGTGNFEDDDFCLRAALAGYKNYIAGDVFIHHYGSRSFIGNTIDYNSPLSGNIKIFDEKWTGLDPNTPLGKKVAALNTIDKAEALSRKGKLDQAVAALIEGIGCAPDEKVLYCHLAEMLLDNKLYKEALDAVDSLPPGAKEDLRFLDIVAYCKEGLGETCDYADRILEKDKAYATALNLKGIIAHKQGDDSAAEGFFLQAIESDPGYGEPYTNRGMLKWAINQKEEALDLLEKGFILSPAMTDNVTLYHSAITELGQFAGAEALARDAKTLHPENKRILFFLIDILIKQGKYDEAMDEIEKAMLSIGIDDGMLAAALEVRNKVGAKEIDGSRKNKGTLSLCMIVKNEEQHLARCLLSAKPAVDEMIMVDTGSTDRTKDIARAYGAKVFDFPWTNDFSAARNHSLSMAAGEWILVLDADEVISPLDYAALERIVKQKSAGPLAYAMVTRNYTNEVASKGWTANDRRYCREEAGTGWFPSLKVRLFPNDKRIRFQNPVHELVEASLERAGIEIKTSDIPVHHYGRFDKDKLIKKGKEYFLLGMRKLKEMEGDIQALKELAVQASELGEYEAGVELWKKVIELAPNNAEAFLNISYAYLKLEKYREALISSRRALGLEPALKEAALNYAGSELIAGDISKTISVLEALLQKDPDYPPAMALVAAAYYVSGQKESGLALFEKLRKMGFDCTEFLDEQYRGVISQGKLEQAVSLLEAAIKTGNTNKDTHRLFAECQSKQSSLPRQEPGGILV